MNKCYPSLAKLPPSPDGKHGWPWNEIFAIPLLALHSDAIHWPRISLVTPSYNQGQFIEETIRSVLLQGYPNLEYWVVDGGSTDATIEIIKKYAPWLAGWVSEKDQGQADAINKGWQQSTGELLGWLNSDDLLTPNSLWDEVKYLWEHPEVGFIYGDLDIVNEKGEFLYRSTYKDFDLRDIVLTAGWISQPGSLIRDEVLEQTGLLDTRLHFQMDLDLWLRAGRVCKFGYLRKPVARFRQHQESKTSSKSYLAAKDIIYIYNKFFQYEHLPGDWKLIQHRAMGSAHFYASRAWFSSNNLRESYKHLLKAVKEDVRKLLDKGFLFHFAVLLVSSLVGGRGTSLYLRIRDIYICGRSRINGRHRN